MSPSGKALCNNSNQWGKNKNTGENNCTGKYKRQYKYIFLGNASFLYKK